LPSLSLSSPARREEAQSYTARESSTHKKTPTRNGRGQPIQAAVPFPRKDVSAPCRAGLLARGNPYSLHLPKAKDLSGLCRFRSAHSCGAAMDLHHLPWAQPEAVPNPTSGVFNSGCELTADYPALSRTFLQRSRELCLSREAGEEDTHHRCARLHGAKPDQPALAGRGHQRPR
jgi:hypothetical protein